MSWGQIVALVFALILLIPGGCFLVNGFGMLQDRQMSDVGGWLLTIGVVILAVVIWLGRFALRKPPTPPSQPPV